MVHRSIHRLAAMAGAVVLAAGLSAPGALAAGPDHAGQPLGVHFDIQTTFAEPSFGPFIATGPAVDGGVICPEGDTVDVDVQLAGLQAASGVFNAQVLKRFDCSDGSGSLLMKLQVHLAPSGGSTEWTVVDGTGVYARLHGRGDGYGILLVADGEVVGVNDLLFGAIHLD